MFGQCYEFEIENLGNDEADAIVYELQHTDGVHEAYKDMDYHRITVDVAESVTSEREIRYIIENMGFRIVN